MSNVLLEHVTKRFGTTVVLDDLSLTVHDGEILALLGPSGSGKTTLLRVIAGFEHPDAGTVMLDGNDVTRDAPVLRHCGMVFQHYALFPHLTVAENVAYGLARERLDRAATAARVAEALGRVDLTGYEHRSVSALSGGQQQRVALARAIAPNPRVLLLDEPLSNLDPTLRDRTRRELRELVKQIGITTILVTHEQEEAFDLADRIALLHLGRLQQVGTAESLYQAPATPFVASFIGRSSVLPGRVTERNGERVQVDAAGATWWASGQPGLSGSVALHLRPESVTLDPAGTLRGAVTARRFAGAMAFIVVALDGGGDIEVAVPWDAVRIGDRAVLAPSGTGAHAFESAG